MTEKQQVHIIVSGRVQGVFFRDFTQRQATKLGLSGWVRNTDNGEVEIIAEGDKIKLNQLIEAVKNGPDRSQVKNCQIDWNNFIKGFSDFEIIY
jgi:acylphosphatase